MIKISRETLEKKTMRLASILSLIFIGFSAQAAMQWGTGQSPASQCPSQYGPGQGATSGNDELSNLAGMLATRNQQIEELRKREQALGQNIQQAKSAMSSVLTNYAIDEVSMHRDQRNSRASYQITCPSSEQRRPYKSDGTDRNLLAQAGPQYKANPNVTAVWPPEMFCQVNEQGQIINLWERFSEDGGRVRTSLCDVCIAGVTRAQDCRDRRSQERCRQGMLNYYNLKQQAEDIRRDIARLDKEARSFERDLVRIRDQIADGSYCATCNSQRRGYATQGAGPSTMETLGILALVGAAALIQSNQQPQRPPMPQGPPGIYGPPPPAMNGPGYPASPYMARVPGYPFVAGAGGPPGGMVYGGVPGGIGPGAFGCQGANPMANGNPWANPAVASIFGGPSPFNNPYANSLQPNPLFNQGAGPGWGYPQYGPPARQNPFGPGVGGSPPAAWGAQPLPGNGFGVNPYAAAGVSPGYGPAVPAYGIAYVPTLTPTLTPVVVPLNPLGGGAAGVVSGPGYGWGGASALPVNYSSGNLYGQYNQLSNRLQMINSGPLSGGSGAPVMLPYLRSAPVYSPTFPLSR